MVKQRPFTSCCMVKQRLFTSLFLAQDRLRRTPRAVAGPIATPSSPMPAKAPPPIAYVMGWVAEAPPSPLPMEAPPPQAPPSDWTSILTAPDWIVPAKASPFNTLVVKRPPATPPPGANIPSLAATGQGAACWHHAGYFHLRASTMQGVGAACGPGRGFTGPHGRAVAWRSPCHVPPLAPRGQGAAS